jgi:hypothetical protein
MDHPLCQLATGLMVLAYAGTRNREFRGLAFAYMLILLSAVAVMIVLLSGLAVIQHGVLNTSGPTMPRPSSFADYFYPGGLWQLAGIIAAFIGIASMLWVAAQATASEAISVAIALAAIGALYLAVRVSRKRTA